MKAFRSLLLALFAVIALGACSSVPTTASADPSASINRYGDYGVVAGSPKKPLVLVFTTDVQASLDGTFTTITRQLNAAGYTVAAVDVTCHGSDVAKTETAGLDCWAARVSKGGPDVFAPMVQRASKAISDINAKGLADGSHVIALGVSRGGYAAARLAIADPRVDTLVLMAPVTDLTALREFAGMSVSSQLYGLQGSYPLFAKKRIFLQIGVSDDRVGTTRALSFVEGISAASGGAPVDLTAVVTPGKGHGTAEHEFAAKWVITGESKRSQKVTAAP